ncbi:hypothetical protein BHE74_00031651 [Ensete ventricosum]|nr:hypothetical protein BHE74_00031651 [Ensete ventricosum]
MDTPQGSPQSSPDAQGSRQRPMDASQGLRQPLMDTPQGSRQPRQQQYQPRRPDSPSGGDGLFNAVVTIFLFVLVVQVRDIPCGTKGGVMISFDKIEVHWIDEKVKDSIQADCTRYAPGIEIISVRVTKPNIPVSIKRNFELMEEERTKALIAIEKQKVAEKEAETQKKIALSEADKIAQVSRIQMEQKLMEKNSTKRQEEIENEMYIAREKSQADANFYRWATVMLIG